MPIYEYKCEVCDEITEEFDKITSTTKIAYKNDLAFLLKTDFIGIGFDRIFYNIFLLFFE